MWWKKDANITHISRSCFLWNASIYYFSCLVLPVFPGQETDNVSGGSCIKLSDHILRNIACIFFIYCQRVGIYSDLSFKILDQKPTAGRLLNCPVSHKYVARNTLSIFFIFPFLLDRVSGNFSSDICSVLNCVFIKTMFKDLSFIYLARHITPLYWQDINVIIAVDP